MKEPEARIKANNCHKLWCMFNMRCYSPEERAISVFPQDKWTIEKISI